MTSNEKIVIGKEKVVTFKSLQIRGILMLATIIVNLNVRPLIIYF